MTPNQREWAWSRDLLAKAVVSLGYPGEFADLLAKQLGSPKAMMRLASYLCQAKPGSLEEIADETLAIRAEIEAWREKKEYLAFRIWEEMCLEDGEEEQDDRDGEDGLRTEK